MPVYSPPAENIKFILHDVLKANQLADLPGYEEFSDDLMGSDYRRGRKKFVKMYSSRSINRATKKVVPTKTARSQHPKDLKKHMIPSPKAVGAACLPTPNMAVWACPCF